MATLADVLKAIKELIAVTERVRDNTERFAKLEEKIDGLHLDMVETRRDTKAILNGLEMKEELSAIKAQLAEHIAACERAKA